MNQTLQMGANTVLNSPKGQLSISYEVSSAIDISLTAFLLTDSDLVQGDNGIIFYNQPESATGVATLLPAEISDQLKRHQLNFDMSKVPVGITKMAITLTEDRGIGFSHVKNLQAEIRTGDEVLYLTPVSFTNEKGIVVVELYIRNSETKARSIWRGFDSGLEGLCKLYGVEVEPDEQGVSTSPPMVSEKQINEPAPINTAAKEKVAAPISLEKVQGKISLDKGHKPIIIEKTPEITATVSWESGTDYDIYALVYTKSGKQIDVAMFGAKGVPALKSYGNGAVEHMGDVGRDRESMKTEVIKLRLNDDIIAVVPVVYSAQSNGTGSFYRYRVSMSIDNHQGTSVTIHAKHANDNDRIYSCVPGILQNTNDGVIIRPLELYSKPNSERRPKLKMKYSNEIDVLMDKGPINDYK
ncbi:MULTISPECIES: TerD family protein [Bacillus]|uniref:Tellurite resistance protein TerA n=1 Tax=Bacillus aerius TaxID=293388 RepID=A0ABR6AWX0_9BACI|nr:MULTISPECIES: TerD family protein [Bacillus]WOQ73625.1 TerD family protein [Bacillus stratosphericus]KQU13255.1 tellurium resistance protein [Bacillus sp. Leaf49]MBA8916376.1 tellurite resistance protein TerA [Bacillus aerius]MCL7874485.1 TerD family protein [Bacillus altitudinis]MCY7621268.1 TerD family protein [Bacillus altitudinis]